MKRVAGLLILTIALCLAQQETAGLDRLLEGVARYQYGDSREPLEQFNQWLRGRYADPAVLAVVEERLAAMLASTSNPATQDFICRHLAVIGTDASVPVLARLLVRPETAEIARYALDRIPGAAATDALLAALGKLTGNARLGVIHSLGARRQPRVTKALIKLLEEREESVKAAAAAALAQQASLAACAALRDAHKMSPAAQQARLEEAVLDCAAGLRDSGNAAAAGGYFQWLLRQEAPLAVRAAALRGLAYTQGAAALARLRPLLGDATHPLHAAAAEATAAIPGEEAAAALRNALEKAAEPVQLIIVSALGRRRSEQNTQTLMRVARTGSTVLRRSAIAALGESGAPSAVTMLASIAAQEPPLQEAARGALLNLNGPGVDEEIAVALGREPVEVRVELVRAAGARRAAATAPILLDFARRAEEPLRSEAIKALRETAGAEHVTAIATLLESASNASERNALKDALAAALLRSENRAVGEVIDAFEKASSVEARQAYLGALGATGAQAALALLRRELRSEDAQMRRAAILALSEWNEGTPAADLLETARQESTLALHVLALRGFVRLVALPSARSDAESVALLAEAMKIARRPEEKRAILGVAPRFPSNEAAALATAALADPALAAEAKAALERIGRSLRTPRTER